MNMELEDIIVLLEEVEDIKIKAALLPQDEVHMTYYRLGNVEGVRAAIRKLENLIRRESY